MLWCGFSFIIRSPFQASVLWCGFNYISRLSYQASVLGIVIRHLKAACQNTCHSCLSADSNPGKVLSRERSAIPQGDQH